MSTGSKVVGIFGSTGDGKSSSFIVSPDGSLPVNDSGKFDINEYKGLDAESSVILNLDGKPLPYPYTQIGFTEGKNLRSSSYDKPITVDMLCPVDTQKDGMLDAINSNNKIKRVIIDTINGGMNDSEMLSIRKKNFDQWYDFAKDFYRLLSKSNSLREDLIIYILGHTAMYEVLRGDQECRLLVNGKKLEKTPLEIKIPIVLHSHVNGGSDGENEHVFETKKNGSSAKTPIGMFGDFEIPNSLKLVDDTIREYYSI